MSLLVLPNELVEIIRSFLLSSLLIQQKEDEINFATIPTLQHQSLVMEVLKLETISKQFSEWFQPIRSNFWFNLLKYEAKNCNELEKWKGRRNLRRMVLLLRWARTQYFIPTSETIQPPKIQERYIVVAGEGGVGKTAIVNQLIYGYFIDDCWYGCSIEDTFRKQFNERTMIELLKLYSQEEYTALIQQAFRSYNSIIYVFSTTHALDENRIEYTKRIFNILVRARDREINDFPVLFAINKIDIPEKERTESVERIISFIGTIIKEFELKNTAIFETSAKQTINMNQIFEHVLKMEDWSQFPFLNAIKEIDERDGLSIEDMKAWNDKKQKKKCILC